MGEVIEFPQSEPQAEPEPLRREAVGRELQNERQRQERTLADVASSAGVSTQYLYLAAWLLALAGLLGLLRRNWPQLSSPLRRAWAVLVAGLSVVALGILGDYGASSDVVGGVGFLLTGIGFLGAAAGCGLLGRALWRGHAVSLWRASAVGALGVVSLFGGLALVGHIPSGPGVGLVGGALFLGLSGRAGSVP